MRPFRFDLEFAELDLPPAMSRVRLAVISREGDEIYVTLDCCSEGELAWQIDKLIAELQTIKRMGRQRYEQWHKKLLGQ